MSSINALIQSEGPVTNWVELSTILGKQSRTSITWWGQRMVTIEGEDFLLNALAEKVIKQSRQQFSSLAERKAACGVEDRLQVLYINSDLKLRASNVFTRFLCWLREFTFNPYTPRFRIEEESLSYQARSLDTEEYQAAFNEAPQQDFPVITMAQLDNALKNSNPEQVT